MNIVEKSLAEIRPYEKNPRRNDGAVDAVAASIREFGFKVPLVLDKAGVIVAGHTRYKAAQKLGLATVPCVVASDLTPKQIKAFRLADNKVSELAGWDFDLLDAELADLSDDFDMGEFGFADLDGDFDGDGAEGDGTNGGDESAPAPSLAERFGVPPFTVLNIDREPMISRNRAWVARGIRSEIGRGGGACLQPGLDGQIGGISPQGGGLCYSDGLIARREQIGRQKR